MGGSQYTYHVPGYSRGPVIAADGDTEWNWEYASIGSFELAALVGLAIYGFLFRREAAPNESVPVYFFGLRAGFGGGLSLDLEGTARAALNSLPGRNIHSKFVTVGSSTFSLRDLDGAAGFARGGGLQLLSVGGSVTQFSAYQLLPPRNLFTFNESGLAADPTQINNKRLRRAAGASIGTTFGKWCVPQLK
jgi:hypothetical protein